MAKSEQKASSWQKATESRAQVAAPAGGELLGGGHLRPPLILPGGRHGLLGRWAQLLSRIQTQPDLDSAATAPFRRHEPAISSIPVLLFFLQKRETCERTRRERREQCGTFQGKGETSEKCEKNEREKAPFPALLLRSCSTPDGTESPRTETESQRGPREKRLELGSGSAPCSWWKWWGCFGTPERDTAPSRAARQQKMGGVNKYMIARFHLLISL